MLHLPYWRFRLLSISTPSFPCQSEPFWISPYRLWVHHLFPLKPQLLTHHTFKALSYTIGALMYLVMLSSWKYGGLSHTSPWLLKMLWNRWIPISLSPSQFSPPFRNFIHKNGGWNQELRLRALRLIDLCMGACILCDTKSYIPVVYNAWP